MIKLQNKINLRFFLLLLSVFSLAGVVLYLSLNIVVDKNIDDILESREARIRENIASRSPGMLLKESPDQSVSIKVVPFVRVRKEYADTVLFDSSDKEYVDGRKLTVTSAVHGRLYEITVTLLRFETEDMVSVILYFMLGLFVIIVIVLLLSHRWMSVRLWRPFYEALQQISLFRVGEASPPKFTASGIHEFERLNAVLETMIEKAQSDYQNLKEFAENASHEIQTPLAIMRSNLELVLQDKSLPTQQYQQILTAFEAASRLSKLSEALLLLSKIENRQFPEETDVDLCVIVRQRLEFIEELVALRKIQVVTDFQSPFILRASPYLAETLINNLLNNALRHNVDNGSIYIESSRSRLIISNTGIPLTIAPDKLFQRFVKHHSGKESTGLGLAIVAGICKNYGLSIEYAFENDRHQIIVTGPGNGVRS